MLRLLHTFLLVFALLFAQVGMVAHAAQHHVAQHDDGGLAAESTCDVCAGYAQLAGAAPLPHALAVPVVFAAAQTFSTPVFSFKRITSLAGLARAPPVFS